MNADELRDELLDTLAVSIGREAALDLLFRYEVTAVPERLRSLAARLDEHDAAASE